MPAISASIEFRYLQNSNQLCETKITANGTVKTCRSIKKTKGCASLEELVVGTVLSPNFFLEGESAKTLHESLRPRKNRWREDIFGYSQSLPKQFVKSQSGSSTKQPTAAIDTSFVNSIRIYVGDRDITDCKGEVEALAHSLGYCKHLLEPVDMIVKLLEQHFPNFDDNKKQLILEILRSGSVESTELKETKNGSVELTFRLPRYAAEAFLAQENFGRIENEFGKLVAWIDKPVPSNPTAEAFTTEIEHCSNLLEKFVVVRAYFKAVATKNTHVLFKGSLEHSCLKRAIVILNSILSNHELRDKALSLSKVVLHPIESEHLWLLEHDELHLYARDPFIGEERLAFTIFGVDFPSDNTLLSILNVSQHEELLEFLANEELLKKLSEGVSRHRVEELVNHLLNCDYMLLISGETCLRPTPNDGFGVGWKLDLPVLINRGQFGISWSGMEADLLVFFAKTEYAYDFYGWPVAAKSELISPMVFLGADKSTTTRTGLAVDNVGDVIDLALTWYENYTVGPLTKIEYGLGHFCTVNGQGIDTACTVKKQQVEDGNIWYTYDARGNLTTVTDGAYITTYSYVLNVDADRLTRISHRNGPYLDYAYDAFGRRIEIDQYGFATKCEYDSAGRLSRINKVNGTFTTYEYDAAGQILSLKNWRTLNSKFDYTYYTMTTVDGSWTFEYNASDTDRLNTHFSIHGMEAGFSGQNGAGKTTTTRTGAVVHNVGDVVFLLGTPVYMSPEQNRRESHRVEERSDQFSSDIVLFELLTAFASMCENYSVDVLVTKTEYDCSGSVDHHNVPQGAGTNMLATISCNSVESVLLPIFETNYKHLLNYVYRIVGTYHDADDILHEVPFAAVRHIENLLKNDKIDLEDIGHLRAILFVVARILSLKFLRYQRTKLQLQQIEPEASKIAPNAFRCTYWTDSDGTGGNQISDHAWHSPALIYRSSLVNYIVINRLFSLSLSHVGSELLVLMKVVDQRQKSMEIRWNLAMIDRVPLISRTGKLIRPDISQCGDMKEFFDAIDFFVDRINHDFQRRNDRE